MILGVPLFEETTIWIHVDECRRQKAKPKGCRGSCGSTEKRQIQCLTGLYPGFTHARAV